jgi:DNA-binding response OmpR family regulator
MPSRILLVEPDPLASAVIEQVLVEGGHQVTAVPSFEAASMPAARVKPDLLIAAVRLGRFNGLHLAIRFRAGYPGLPIIVIGDDEVGLAAEAMQLRARFVPRSIPPGQFLEFIDQLVSGRAPRDLVSTRRWPRRPATLSAHLAEDIARVVDIGYGGLRLECTRPPADAERLDVSLPSVGMVVKGVLKWAQPTPDKHSWLCGLELDTHATDTRRWRRVVDAVRGES